MATKTKADIIKETMEYLSELESQEQVSDEDSDYVGRKYDELHETLEEKKLAYWSSNAVPNAVAHLVVVALAGMTAPRYVTDLGERANFEAKIPSAIREIRSITAKPDDGLPTRHVYF